METKWISINFIKEDKIMAMEISGNLPDYAVRRQNYGSYAAQGMAGNKKTGRRYGGIPGNVRPCFLEGRSGYGGLQ